MWRTGAHLSRPGTKYVSGLAPAPGIGELALVLSVGGYIASCKAARQPTTPFIRQLGQRDGLGAARALPLDKKCRGFLGR